MIFASTFLLLAHMASAEIIQRPDPLCDFIYIIRVNKKIEITNPGYPALYKNSLTCRWIVNCPEKFHCLLRCHDVAMPQTEDCELDRLLVSTIGNLVLNGARAHCGRRQFEVASINQRLTIGLITSADSTGGRFRCTVMPVRAM